MPGHLFTKPPCDLGHLNGTLQWVYSEATFFVPEDCWPLQFHMFDGIFTVSYVSTHKTVMM